jgi:hypothetical protein
MWMILVFLLGMVFVFIGIAKNKNEEYLKKGAFSAIIISILASILFLSCKIELVSGGTAIGFGFFDISADKASMLLNLSMIIAFFSLIIYLFSDYQS